MTEPVKFVDLAAQHAEVASAVEEGFSRVLAATSFVGGPDVAAFEQAWAGFTRQAHAVGVGNGTDALELALRAMDLRPGGRVAVPANSFAASANAVVRAGGSVVFVDCDDHHLMDPDRLDEVAGEVDVIMPVHLYGQMADMERIGPVAERRGAAVLEDAAQAHGASRHGRPQGAEERAAAWSFYPGKNLGAYGEAGGITTDDPILAASARALRNHGGEARYQHDRVGFNARLDTLQAVVLLAKLERLAAWNEARRVVAAGYDRLLEGVEGVVRPSALPGNQHVWHLYVIRVAERDRVLEGLQVAGVQAGIHYPSALHLLPAFAHLGHGPGDFPVAERLAGEILSLPMHPHVSADDQELVVETLAGLL